MRLPSKAAPFPSRLHEGAMKAATPMPCRTHNVKEGGA